MILEWSAKASNTPNIWNKHWRNTTTWLYNRRDDYFVASPSTGIIKWGIFTCPSLAMSKERELSNNIPIQKIRNTPRTKRKPFSTAPRFSSLSNQTLASHSRTNKSIGYKTLSESLCGIAVRVVPNHRHLSAPYHHAKPKAQKTSWLPATNY